MRFLSVCSGIEAASVAWNPLGWKAWAFSEIEAFPSAVLAHHYPTTPNLGDMTKFKDWPDATVDLVCGGTPCQSFSNAGLRAGLDDPRGQLMLTFGAIAARYRPRWLVWENVPGVLSSGGGRDFGAFLGLLGFLGYGFAYRVLDAQFVRVDGYARAVPQRRQRVFVVGCLGDWRSAAAVLLERESLRGDPAPRRSAGARVAATLTRGAESSGRGGYAGRRQEDDINIVAGALKASMGRDDSVAGTLGGVSTGGGWRIGPDEAAANQLVAGPIDVATALTAHPSASGRMDFASETFIAFDTTQITSAANFSNPQPGGPCHPLAAHAHAPAIAFNARQDPINGPIDCDGSTNGVMVPVMAFQERGRDGGRALEVGGDVAYALTAPNQGGRGQERNVMTGASVRRLMPVECERLQGFPDGYTAITYRGKPAADGPRYKALGNSWAIPPVRWIGMRIAMVDSLALLESEAA